MLLVLMTVLTAIYAKRFNVVVLFVIVSHLLLGIVSGLGIGDWYKDIIISTFISLAVGMIAYAWMAISARRYGAAYTTRVKKRVTVFLSLPFLIIVCLNIWIVFLGMEKGLSLMKDAKHRVPQPISTQTTAYETKEDIGFGIISDPMVINPISGELTSSAIRKKKDEYTLERRNGVWTLSREALSSVSVAYDIGTGLGIWLSTERSEKVGLQEAGLLFDGIPPIYHKELAWSAGSVQAWAKRGRIQECLLGADRLKYSGWAGWGAIFMIKIVSL